MAWSTPKTDWATDDAISTTDMNRIEENANTAVPIGAVMMYAGSGSVPANYLVCDGSAYNTTTYADLYTVLGSGNLPDLRDKFIAGAGSTYSTGDTGGEATHTLTTGEMPAHSHGSKVATQFYYTRGGSSTGHSYDDITDGDDASSSPVTNAGSGNAHENRPPYYAMRYIIRAL